MTPAIGSKISLETGGAIEEGVLVAAEIPATPTISVVAGTNSVIVTINGDAGVMNHLVYKAESDGEWKSGGSQSGNGDLSVSGLFNNVPYIFQVYSENAQGAYSLWSLAVTVTLAALAANKFDELLIVTAPEFLTEFGVPIEYLPYGGGSRAILAIIDRGIPGEFGGIVPGAQTELIFIEVMNDPVEGISSSELDRSRDKVKLPVRIGEITRERLITEIITQDAGMIKLKVR